MQDTSVSEYIYLIEELEQELKKTRKEINQLLKEAVANGFNKRAIQEVIRVRKIPKKEREQQQLLFDTYLNDCDVPPKFISFCKSFKNINKTSA